MVHTLAEAFRANFLGNSPDWYKLAIIGFLILNPILFVFDPFIAGWALILEFIFTLAMALKCYPLQPGGLLAVEAIVLGMASPEMVYVETEHNFPVIMLLMFMVAGIYFLREMLLFTFTKILLGVRSKILLSLMFSFAAAFLSAFLDALTSRPSSLRWLLVSTRSITRSPRARSSITTTTRRPMSRLSNCIVRTSRDSGRSCAAS